MIRTTFAGLVLLPVLVAASSSAVASTYLNQSNISVTVGEGTSPGSFNNTFAGTSTITKVIDAPTAIAEEFHNQTTHIWHTASEAGGGLELKFDFGLEYDLSVLHFWNYTGESFDVDNVDFTFYNANNVQNGVLSVAPDLGSSPGIRAQDLVLAAPLNVRYVTAFLTGSNQQVDFQNIGFTANVSAPVPEPGTYAMMGLGAFVVLSACHRKRQRDRSPTLAV